MRLSGIMSTYKGIMREHEFRLSVGLLSPGQKCNAQFIKSNEAIAHRIITSV